MQNLNNTEILYKWYILLVSDKKKDLIIKKLFSIIKENSLENYIKEIQLPNSLEMKQTEDTKISFVNSITSKGFILLNIRVFYDHVNKIYIMPEEVKLELKKLKLKFLSFNYNNPIPLNDIEFSQMFINNKTNNLLSSDNNEKKDFNINEKVIINNGILNRYFGKVIRSFIKPNKQYPLIEEFADLVAHREREKGKVMECIKNA